MKRTSLKMRHVLAGLAAIAFAVSWSAPAFSACAVAVGEGIANSQGRAVSRAKRQAQTQMRQSSGFERVTNMSFSDPACLYLDDGTNRQKCRIELSFCTQPKLPQPAPPPLPNPPSGGGGGQCANLSSQSDASDLRTAKSLVQRAIDRALRQRYGASLNDPRVSGSEPACYYKDDGTNAAHCELRIRYCP